MSTDYERLLDATLEHLQQLKREGRRFIPVTSAGWELFETRATKLKTAQDSVPEITHSSSAQPCEPAPRRQAATSISPPGSFAIGNAQPMLIPAAEPSPQAVPMDKESKIRAMQALQAQVMSCVKCPHLAASRKKVVFGVGDIHANLMFVGEAPGADEDRQGEPFVGAAGQLLTRIITAMGLSRQTVYIANILKCRPDTPGQGSGNRKPTLDEMKTCLPWLEKQIDLIQPQVIVALGATAVEGLLGACQGISRMRGQWQSYRKIPLMPTFHPSYLLRGVAMTEKRKVWEDMLQVMTRLGLPISEKQRNYFLSGSTHQT